MTRGANKSYTRQFREQAMDLVRVQGLEPTAAARDLGMPFSTLNLWLRKAGWVRRVDGPHAPPLPEDPAALKVRVAELERQVKRLELEMEILKKATAFFAGQSP
jgi:transposase